MSDVEKRLGRLEESVGEIREVLFDGIQTTSMKMSNWLDNVAPHLMTAEKHEQIEAHREEVEEARAEGQKKSNEELGKRRDRTSKFRTVVIGGVVAGGFGLAGILLRAFLNGG